MNKISKITLTIVALIIAMALICTNVYADVQQVPTLADNTTTGEINPNAVPDANTTVDPNAVADPNATVDPNAVADPNATVDPNGVGVDMPTNTVVDTQNTTTTPTATNEVSSTKEETKLDSNLLLIAIAAIGGFVFINFILSILIFIRTGRR